MNTLDLKKESAFISKKIQILISFSKYLLVFLIYKLFLFI